MPQSERADSTLPLHCPKCDHDGAKLSVSSHTILTVECLACGHAWSAEISALPEQLRVRLPRLVQSMRVAS